MATPNRATQGKRNRERDKMEKKQEKQEKRLIRIQEKKDRPEGSDDGIDPDLIGIFPGPQPELVD